MTNSASSKFMELEGKVALITGGATGIGLAIADALLSKGVQLAYLAGIVEKDGANAEQEMIKKHGEGRCIYIHLDVNNEQQFEDAFKDIISKNGSVDILVNNAGLVNEKKWELVVDTNFKAVMRGCMLALKYMSQQKNKGGCVMNTASILGFDASYPYIPAYVSTKHAIVGLTRALGDPVHYEEYRIRIIGLCPGVTETGLVSDPHSYHWNADWAKKNLDQLGACPKQKVDVVAKGAVYMLENGPPGSLWVVEDSMLYRVEPPERQSFQTKIMNL